MYDHFSDESQPDIESRVAKAIKKLPSKYHTSVPSDTILMEATNVCNESRNFSLAGWMRWGHTDEVERLTKILDNWIVKFDDWILYNESPGYTM